MMQPLSRRIRVGYLIVCFLLFIILVPAITLYATGYRLTGDFEITRTGGLYMSVGQSGAQIYVNDKYIKDTSVFQKGVLVQNLNPGTYKVSVVKEGYHEWNKELRVFNETVTEAKTLMLPQEPGLTEILEIIIEEPEASTSPVIKKKNPEFKAVAELFAKGTTASSTAPKTINKITVTNTKGQLTVAWLSEGDNRPTYFCTGTVCKDEIGIVTSEPVRSFYFLPGRDDQIIFSTTSGIYVAEIDDRSRQNIQPVVERPNLELRVDDNNIYMKDGKKFFSIAL